MRWSWPAFSSGVAVGVLVALFLAWEHGAPDNAVPSPALSGEHAAAVAPAAAQPVVRPRRGESARKSGEPAPNVPAAEESAAEEAEKSGEAAPAAPTVQATGDVRIQLDTVASAWVVANEGVAFRATFTPANGEKVLISAESSASPVSAPVAQGLARARAAADALVASGGGSSDADVDEMLRSSDDGDREAAIGLAARSQPPMTARLLAVARDVKVGGSVRATALVAAAEAAPGDAAVGEAVAALAADRDVTVRRTAIELLPRFPRQGGDRAIAILRAGDYTGELLDPLARTVAASDRAADFLFANPAPDAAFAVLRALPMTTPVDANARARLVARLPDAIRPLLGLPEMLAHAGEAFGVAASAGHVVFLRSIAVSPSLPTALRLAAIDAAIAAAECADGRAALLASALADGRSPVEFLRAVLQRVPAGDVADGGVKSSIAALAESHPNEWLREEARAKLQASPIRADAGGLRIVSGIYGKDGKTVDVTAVLQSMVVGGRLVVEAGNALAGDPLFGIVKDLTVTYEWKGERRTRTIHEYETLTLP